jgi:hypothetical protein
VTAIAACSSDEMSTSEPSTSTRPAAVKVPADFPRDDVPLPTVGTIDAVGSDSSDGKQFFTITYVVPGQDLNAALASFTDALRTKGFDVTPASGTQTASGFTAAGKKWDVTVQSAVAGTDGGDGGYTLQVRPHPSS